MANSRISRNQIREFWLSQAGQQVTSELESRLRIEVTHKLEAIRNDPNKCWACQRKINLRRLERCHIIPASSNGQVSIDNLILMCRMCHLESPTIDHPDALWIWLSLKRSWPDEIESVCDQFVRSSNLSYEGWRELCEEVESDESIMPVSGQISAAAWLSILITKGADLEQARPDLVHQDLFTRQKVMSDLTRFKQSLSQTLVDRIMSLSTVNKSPIKKSKITYLEIHTNMQKVRDWFNQGQTIKQIEQLCKAHGIRTSRTESPSHKTIRRWCEDLLIKRSAESIAQVRAWREEGIKLKDIYKRCQSEGIRTQRGNIPTITQICRWCKDIEILEPIERQPQCRNKTRIENRPQNMGLTELIFKLRDDGLSYDKIADRLEIMGFCTSRGNPISKTQILRIVRNNKA